MKRIEFVVLAKPPLRVWCEDRAKVQRMYPKYRVLTKDEWKAERKQP